MPQLLLMTTRRAGISVFLAFCALTAKANQVTVTVTGTISIGTDNTGVFGFPAGTNLAGQNFTLTFTFDDTKGTQSSAPCAATGQPYYSAISGGSGGTSSPGTAVLQIGNGSWTFGAAPNVSLTSGATRSVPCGTSITTDSVDFYVNDVPPTGYIADQLAISLVTPQGGTPLTTDGNWEDPFSTALTPAYSANRTNSFLVDQWGYKGILLGVVNQASGFLVPSNITVSVPGGSCTVTDHLSSNTTASVAAASTCSCSDPSSIKIVNFVVANQAAADLLQTQTGLSSTFILAWAGWESGYGLGSAPTLNNNFFGLTTTAKSPTGGWSGAINCSTLAPPTFPNFACFSSNFLGNDLYESGVGVLFAQSGRYLNPALLSQDSGGSIADIGNAIRNAGFNNEPINYGGNIQTVADAIARRSKCLP